MAFNDYEQKTGVFAANVESVLNADGTLSIILIDENGEILDTYVIDPITANGTDKSGNEVNLPQTGNNSFSGIDAAVSALILILLGAFAVVKSHVIRKKDNEQ